MEISKNRLSEVIYQVAGAATGPLLADHPTYVFPSERVLEAVEHCLRENDLEELIVKKT